MQPSERMHAPNWPSLRHAYGPAGDIPALLERTRNALAPGDYRDEPWFSLWSALCRQGDVYTASYAAVPELVALAEARGAEPRVAWECLLLAGSIELERALPEGAAPPPVPTELALAYTAALRCGAELASRYLAQAVEPEIHRGFALSYAALRGDVAEARLLADGPDDRDTE